ncbi:MAG: hypothetical protein Q8Q89_01850 [bacterium]|nr:hypothetical protein [bacterium]
MMLKPEEVLKIRNHFKELGFKNIEVKQTFVPVHIVNWMMEEGVLSDKDDEGQEIQEMVAGLYVRIETVQGSFGLLGGPYPMMDIEGTGVTAQDLGYDKEEPPFLLNMADDKDIFHFRKLLEAKSKNT